MKKLERDFIRRSSEVGVRTAILMINDFKGHSEICKEDKELFDFLNEGIKTGKGMYLHNKEWLQKLNVWDIQYDKYYSKALKGKLNYEERSKIDQKVK